MAAGWFDLLGGGRKSSSTLVPLALPSPTTMRRGPSSTDTNIRHGPSQTDTTLRKGPSQTSTVIRRAP